MRRLCADGNTVRRGRWLPDVWRQAYEKKAMESAMSKAGQTGNVNIETDGRRPRQRHPCVWRKASRLDATSTIAALVCRGTRAFQWKGQGRANGRSHTCTARLFMWRREVGKTVTVIPPGRARAAGQSPGCPARNRAVTPAAWVQEFTYIPGRRPETAGQSRHMTKV